MNQLETMRFVDKATPQQLTAMVNARDPFSYMALSKLQQIRDERMKAQAGQPAPPPMAEVIPQQVAQGAPQMPQSMAQPPQMGIASLGGIGPDKEAAGAGGGMVAFTQGGGIKGYATAGKIVNKDADFWRSTFDDALKDEGVIGTPFEPVARSLFEQESTSGKDTRTSNAGAVGPMQILPSTFKSVADKDWDIQDPSHNIRAGIRYAGNMFKLAGGDPALTAAGYYGGPGGLAKARLGQAVSDPRNPNAPNTLEYGQKVASRIPQPPDRPLTIPEQTLGMLTGSSSAQGAVPTDASVDERPGYGGAAAAASLLGGAKAIEGINASRAADLAKFTVPKPYPKPPITLGSAASSTLSGIKNIGSTIGNVTKPLAAGVSRLPLLGTGYTAVADTYPTKTEDFRTRFGMERGDSAVGKYAAIDPEFYKDMGVRALGLGSDVLNNMTFGSLSRVFADQYDQDTGQKITKQKANEIANKVKEEAKKTVVATDKIPPDGAKPDVAKPVAVDPERQNIDSLLTQMNASIGKRSVAREELTKAAETRNAASKFDVKDYDLAIGDLPADRKKLVEEYKTLFPNPNDDLKKQLNELKTENKSATEQAPYQGLLKMGLALMANKSPHLATAVGEAGASGLEEYSRIQSLNKQEKAKLLEADSRLAQANDLRNQNQYAMADKETRLSQQARKDRYTIQHDAKVAEAGLAFQVAQVRAGASEEDAKNAATQLTAALQIHTAYKGPEQQLLFNAMRDNPDFARFVQTEKELAAYSTAFNKAYAEQDQQAKISAAAGNPVPTHAEMLDRAQQVAMKEIQGREALRNKPLGKVPGKP